MLIGGQNILNTPLYHALSILCANLIHAFSAGHVIFRLFHANMLATVDPTFFPI